MSLTVLIVDDEVDIREAIRNLLADEGHVVVEASNGREALDALPRSRPDLILLDLMMPVMSGFQFLEAIALLEQWRSTPVIILTAAVELGSLPPDVLCVLKKPFRIEELLQAIKALRAA